MHTKEGIKTLLNWNDSAVEKGIVRIYQLQTADEQAGGATKHLNGKGFNARDAKYGTYLAKWVLSKRHLTGKHLAAARKMCLKYSGQLTDIANGRLAA